MNALLLRRTYFYGSLRRINRLRMCYKCIFKISCATLGEISFRKNEEDIRPFELTTTGNGLKYTHLAHVIALWKLEIEGFPKHTFYRCK